MIDKVRPHITQNEPLLFESSSPGKKGYQLPELDVPHVDPKAVLGVENVRGEIEGFSRVLAPMMASAVRRATRADLARLKRILETG